MMFTATNLVGIISTVSMLSTTRGFIISSRCLQRVTMFDRHLYSSNRLISRTSIFSSESNAIEWPVEKVRDTFVDYFVKKQSHVNYKSSPVVPVNDNTLLFANAGMNQFKPIFIGTVEPTSPLAKLTRAVNSQKCIRAGGKHNDLEDVGKDTYHHTFFEMLGTWSFGNYFKREAIEMAYDILVNVYKLPKERLYVSYFAGDKEQGLECDDEAKNIWLKFIPEERVLPFDKKANFWEMGETGPCGPCSEIHFDRIGNRDASSLVNADDPNVIEIWNLVFIQYNREQSGELKSLPSKHIDTGMGLERLTSILQSKYSNYDTDIFGGIFQGIQNIIGCAPYTGKLGAEDAQQNFKDMAYRVISDHIRTLTFAITDGATPSNEGRGYVLRRILRRAIRYGRQTLGAPPGFFAKLVPVVVEEMGSAFPELRQKIDTVTQVISEEEEAFSSLLDRGVKYFAEVVQEVKSSEATTLLSGETAFYLYDTLGFPFDLTQLMAAEQGLSVDKDGFETCMLQQKERSRDANQRKKLAGRVNLALGPDDVAALQKLAKPTDDSYKYNILLENNNVAVDTSIVAILTENGLVDQIVDADADADTTTTTVGLVLSDTPFYAEAGGQVSDTGNIIVSINGKETSLKVLDVQSFGGYILHICSTEDLSNSNGGTAVSLQGLSVTSSPSVKAVVDYSRRRKIAPNHTMTHVMNYALQKVLGNNADQKGSLVNEHKLRFDFSSSRALTSEDIKSIESIVNDQITSRRPVYTSTVPLAAAKGIAGLRAVFGETYPDPVRVVSVGMEVSELLKSVAPATASDTTETLTSIEFCGGTHLQNTADAQSFVITEETAVARGIRRISAITGEVALQAVAQAAAFRSKLNELDTLANRVMSESGDVSPVESAVSLVRGDIEGSGDVLGLLDREELRLSVDKLQRGLAAQRKARLMQGAEVAISQAVKEAVSCQGSGVSGAVIVMAAGHDAKVLKKAMEDIKKAAPGLSFLVISTSPSRPYPSTVTTDAASAADGSMDAEEDVNKVSCFSCVTDKDKTTIKADVWLAKALEAVGGRGGGRAVMAQGSAGNVNDLSVVVEAAKSYLALSV